jgi:hypothetical protein
LEKPIFLIVDYIGGYREAERLQEPSSLPATGSDAWLSFLSY